MFHQPLSRGKQVGGDGWIDGEVVGKPVAARWPLVRRDVTLLRAGERVTLVTDWRSWSSSPRLRCRVVSPAVRERSALGVEWLLLELESERTGERLIVRFQPMPEASHLELPASSSSYSSTTTTLDDGSSITHGDSFHVFSSSSQSSPAHSPSTQPTSISAITHTAAKPSFLRSPMLPPSSPSPPPSSPSPSPTSSPTSSPTASSSSLSSSSCSSSFESTDHAWLIPNNPDLLPPAPRLLVRSRFVGAEAEAHYTVASIPDEVYSLSQLAPPEVVHMKSVRRTLRWHGSRNPSLFLCILRNSFPRLTELCRERLLRSPATSSLVPQSSALGNFVWYARVCQYLNRITPLINPKDLRSSATTPVSDLRLGRGPLDGEGGGEWTAFFVDETSPTCGLPTCGNASFDYQQLSRCEITGFACSCRSLHLPVDSGRMLRCEWFRVNSPPLHKLDQGYWTFASCATPLHTSHQSSQATVQLCYTGTWITGLNTTDVWIPE